MPQDIWKAELPLNFEYYSKEGLKYSFSTIYKLARHRVDFSKHLNASGFTCGTLFFTTNTLKNQ